MTVPTAYEPVQYSGNSVTTVFSFPYVFFENSDLLVTLTLVSTGADTVQVLDTDYSVSGGDGEDGSITFLLAAPPTGYRVTIELALPYTQEDDYVENQAFPANTLESGLDRAAIRDQQLLAQTQRSLKFPNTLAGSLIGVLPMPEDGKALIWNGTTGAVENGPDASDIAGAQGYAEDAITASEAAIAAQEAAEAAAVGMKWRPPVRVATTANITLSGEQTIDGISAVTGDRVLVKDQSTPSQNGVYVVAPSAWSRATDANVWDELVSQCVAVSEGSTLADYTYICTSDAGGTLGVTAVTWSTFKIVLQDGAVSTTAKLVDGIVTYAKLAAAAIASGADLIAGTASKLVDAAGLKNLLDSKMTLSTFTALSGTSTDITAPASDYKKFTLNVVGASLSGTASLLIQLIDAGGAETSGHLGAGSTATSGITTTNYTAGLGIPAALAANVFHGAIIGTLANSSTNLWTFVGILNCSDSARSNITSGSKALSQALSGIRITTTNGTDTLDAGSVSVLWEK